MALITAETAAGQLAFDCETGKKLVLGLEDNGIDILHRCGGNARCTTCRVEIIAGDPGPIQDAEKTILSTKPDITETTRLSCQIRIMDDLHLKVVRQASVEGIDAGTRPEE